MIKVKPSLGSHAKSFETPHELQSLLGFPEAEAGIIFVLCTAVKVEIYKLGHQECIFGIFGGVE